jgi:hypothetical protein
MTGELEPAPSPFGRYFTPRKQRIGNVVTSVITLALPFVFLATEPEGGPTWFIGVFVAMYVIGIIGAISQWFIPLTIIDAEGIQRGWIIRRPRTIEWSEVFDARHHSSFGSMKYVLLLLWSGKQVPLYGVTEDAVEGIRRIAAENPAHPAHQHPAGPVKAV